MKKDKRDLPQEKQEKYLSRIEVGQKFNAEIRDGIKDILNKISMIRWKLQKNIWKKETDEGHLTHVVGDYLACFPGVDKIKLDKLLNADLEHWQ